MAESLLDFIGSDITPDSDRWTRGYDLDARECARTWISWQQSGAIAVSSIAVRALTRVGESVDGGA